MKLGAVIFKPKFSKNFFFPNRGWFVGVQFFDAQKTIEIRNFALCQRPCILVKRISRKAKHDEFVIADWKNIPDHDCTFVRVIDGEFIDI